MEKIKIMISSRVVGLEEERAAIASVFNQYDFIQLIGAEPYADHSIPESSAVYTLSMARDCDFYVLILGDSYGMETTEGKSATEVEYDAAYQADPTKIVVFLKECQTDKIEPKQKRFIDRVCNYYSGYWRTTFNGADQIPNLVKESFFTWLKDRAQLGKDLTSFDHFVRLAIQKKPDNQTCIYYQVRSDYIEIEYDTPDDRICVHFDRMQILKDFWGCLHTLGAMYNKMKQERLNELH